MITLLDILNIYANAKNIAPKTFKNAKCVINKWIGNISISQFVKNYRQIILKILSSNLAILTKIEYLKIITKLLRFTIRHLNLPARIKKKLIRIIQWLSSLIKNLPKETKIPLHEKLIRDEEFVKLFNSCFNNYEKTVLVLLSLGLRRSEIKSLRIRDFELKGDHIIVHIYSSKTKKFRKIVIPQRYTELVINVLSRFKICGDDYRPFSIDLNHFLYKLCKRAGIKRRITPHMFRHTFATLISKYLPEIIVKLLMGWSISSRVIERYIHLSIDNVLNMFIKILDRIYVSLFSRKTL